MAILQFNCVSVLSHYQLLVKGERKMQEITIDYTKEVDYNQPIIKKRDTAELTYSIHVLGIQDTEIVELIDCRILEPRKRTGSSTVYAIVWFKIGDFWQIGTGKAGGCGYDKKSSAINEAVINAGINCAYFSGMDVDCAKSEMVKIAEKVISDKKLNITSVCTIETYA